MAEDATTSPNDPKTQFNTASEPVTGKALERIRHDYYVGALMNESDDKSIGGLNINLSGRKNSNSLNQSKRARDNALFLAVLESSLASIETGMITKYGEDFAENMAAEYLDEDSYLRLMSIEDKEERRRQIAVELNEGISNGTIDPAVIAQNPDFTEWLDVRRVDEQRRLEKYGHNGDNDLKSGRDTAMINNSDTDEQRTDQSYDLTNGSEEKAFDNIFSINDPKVV